MGALLTIDISLLLPIEPILPTRSVLALQVRISVSHLLSVLPSPPTPPRFETTGGGGEGVWVYNATMALQIVSKEWDNCFEVMVELHAGSKCVSCIDIVIDAVYRRTREEVASHRRDKNPVSDDTDKTG